MHRSNPLVHKCTLRHRQKPHGPRPPRGCWLAGHVLLGASVEAARGKGIFRYSNNISNRHSRAGGNPVSLIKVAGFPPAPLCHPFCSTALSGVGPVLTQGIVHSAAQIMRRKVTEQPLSVLVLA